MNENDNHTEGGETIMASTKTKKQRKVEEPEVTEQVATGIRPNDLAKELNVDGKRIRAWLRTNFKRSQDDHNTNWMLTDEQAQAVRDRFTKSPKDEA